MKYEYDPLYALLDRHIETVLRNAFGAETTTGETTFLDNNEIISVEAIGIRRKEPKLIVFVSTCVQLTGQHVIRLVNKMQRFSKRQSVYQGWPVKGLIACESATATDVLFANKRNIAVGQITEEAVIIAGLTR